MKTLIWKDLQSGIISFISLIIYIKKKLRSQFCAAKINGSWFALLVSGDKRKKTYIHGSTQLKLLPLLQLQYCHFSNLLQVWGKRWVDVKESRLSSVLLNGSPPEKSMITWKWTHPRQAYKNGIEVRRPTSTEMTE